MTITRKEFIASTAAFAVSPMLAADGRKMRTPQMLDTKRMAIWDGPGIRTTFFVKGCPLKCIWCHNPESIKTEAQWARFQHLCKHHEHCTMDEATCPTRALKLYGKPMTIVEIVAKALEDKAFMQTVKMALPVVVPCVETSSSDECVVTIRDMQGWQIATLFFER